MCAEHAEHRDWVAGKLHGDKHRRDSVGDDQYHVLSNLRIRDAFHTAENSVKEDDKRGDPDTPGVAHF